MKTMTCKQLGGACDHAFQAETFEEMAALSQKHAREMWQKGDEAHIQAMQEMHELMQNPDSMNAWMDKKQQEFDAL